MMFNGATTLLMTVATLLASTGIGDAAFLEQAGDGVVHAGLLQDTTGTNMASEQRSLLDLYIKAARAELPEHQVSRPAATTSMARSLRLSDQCLSKSRRLSLLSKTNSSASSVGILKDGFAQVACVKDYMFYYADRTGDNKDQYKSSRTGVAITHYSGADSKQMSPQVCFEFCREKEGALFFGIRNGRDCYCEPYFQPMADDDTMCDALCEGSQTEICGGQAKSTVFEMHLCGVGDMKSDYSEAESAFLKVMNGKKVPNPEFPHEFDWGLVGDAKNVMKASVYLQALCANDQKFFSKLGNSEIADMLQDCKVFAGTLEHKAENANELLYEGGNKYLGKNMTKTVAQLDYSDQAAVQKTEESIAGLKDMMRQFESKRKELHPLVLGHCFDGTVFPLCSGEATSDPATWGEDVCETRADSRLKPSPQVGDSTPFRKIKSINGVKFAYPGVVLPWKSGRDSLPGEEVMSTMFKSPATFMDVKNQKPIKMGERVELCTGRLLKPAIVASADVCAEQCLHMTDCVGFSSFFSEYNHTYTKVNNTAGALPSRITEASSTPACFLFSKIETVAQFEVDRDPSCEEKRSRTGQQMWKKYRDMQFKCRLKGSKFVETTIKTDPSGKCSSGSPSCIKKFTTTNFCTL